MIISGSDHHVDVEHEHLEAGASQRSAAERANHSTDVRRLHRPTHRYHVVHRDGRNHTQISHLW